MQSQEAPCEEGERALKKLKFSRSSQSQEYYSDNSSEYSSPKAFSIFEKLLELENEFSTNDNIETVTGLRKNSLLLEKLVARERLNTIILNLQPCHKGFSLAFAATSRSDPYYSDDTANMIEVKQWPYDVDYLLNYVDNEELPPLLVELLDSGFSYLFYNGCIIAEVRDYRQAYPQIKCDIHHVLLRPTLQSLLVDVNIMMKDKTEWGSEESQQLESQLLLLNEPNLCLDPDCSLSDRNTQIIRNQHMWNTNKFRRTAKKFSTVTVNRKRKLDQFTHRPGLELYNYLAKQNRLKSNRKAEESRTMAMPIPNLDSPALCPPESPVTTHFKAYQRPKDTSDCLPQLIEEYVLETDMPTKDKDNPRVYHIKLSILQRPSTTEFLGELYLDRDHKKNERNGVACRFSLGSQANANRYINQFTEIFTENGRKSARIQIGFSAEYKERLMNTNPTNQTNMAQQHLNQLSQTLQNQTTLVNGTIGLVHQNQTQNTSNVSVLGATSIKSASQQITNQELETNALTTMWKNSAQQFQAAANAKQQQQQKIVSGGSHTAIINLLNSSPASNVNNDASVAVVNAINNASLLPHQIQTINQKLLARKMTLQNARVLNHGNIIAINNNRMNLQELSQQQGQTITLSASNSGANFTNYTTVPLKQVNQRILTNSDSDSSNKSGLSALLVGTPAANRPDIVGPNTNSLLLEKLAGASNNSATTTTTHFIQNPKQFMVQSPKANSNSPMSSPPPQNTINVHSLNFAQLQSLQGLQNVQVQLPGFAQPISLSSNVSSTGNIQGHPTGLIVSLAVTSPSTSNTTTQVLAGSGANSLKAPTVVLTNASTSNLAQLVSSGVKGINQQGIRSAGPQTVSISQGVQPFQLITPLQRPRLQQTGSSQQNLSSRTLQRTPIIMMAASNANATQVTLPSNSSLANQLQKQAQLQQYQQLCMSQQKNVLGKMRRRSNTSEPQ